MKTLVKGFAILSTLLILASCGGTSESDIIGTWKIDAKSVDIKLGDGFPAEMKAMVEKGKSEMKEAESDMEAVSIEFKEGGKLTVSVKGESQEVDAKWSIDGDYLVIDGEFEGKKGSIKLKLEEVSSDKMELSLSAEDLLAQVKKDMPEALSQVPPSMDIDAMVKGTKLMVALKK